MPVINTASDLYDFRKALYGQFRYRADSAMELLGNISRDNLSNLWHAAHNKYAHAHLSQPADSQSAYAHHTRHGSYNSQEPVS